MGHIKPKRKVCYQTADGRIHNSKKEAELYVGRLVRDLERSKAALKAAVEHQKELKKRLKRFIHDYNNRLISGYETPQWYVSQSQQAVARHAVQVRIAERQVESLKKRLKGE